MNGAGISAKSAACALGVIKDGQIVVHRNSSVGAGARTLGTTDTAVCAHLTSEDALVVVRTSDSDDNAVLLHLDGSVRTVLCAKSAACATV